MQLPEDCRLTYTVSHESWYYRAAHEHETLRGGETGQYLMVHASSDGGGVAWEFRVDQYQFNSGGDSAAVRVAMFNDSWSAFEQVPEFFGLLAAQQPVTLAAVRVILDALGAADVTEREMPHRCRGAERTALVQKVADAQAELAAHDAAHADAASPS